MYICVYITLHRSAAGTVLPSRSTDHTKSCWPTASSCSDLSHRTRCTGDVYSSSFISIQIICQWSAALFRFPPWTVLCPALLHSHKYCSGLSSSLKCDSWSDLTAPCSVPWEECLHQSHRPQGHPSWGRGCITLSPFEFDLAILGILLSLPVGMAGEVATLCWAGLPCTRLLFQSLVICESVCTINSQITWSPSTPPKFYSECSVV